MTEALNTPEHSIDPHLISALGGIAAEQGDDPFLAALLADEADEAVPVSLEEAREAEDFDRAMTALIDDPTAVLEIYDELDEPDDPDYIGFEYNGDREPDDLHPKDVYGDFGGAR